MHLFNVVIYSACAVLWLIRWMKERETANLILVLIWLGGALVWGARYIKSKNKE